MRRFRTAAALFLGLFFLSLPTVTANGEQPKQGIFFSLDRGSAKSGDLVSVNVRAADADPSIAGFRVHIEYDGSALEYAGSKISPQIESGTLQVNGTGNPVTAVYVCNVERGYAPELSGTVAAFRFRVKPGATESAEFDCQTDELCDFDGNALGGGCSASLSLNVEDAAAREPRLTALAPSQGTLSPDFSPDVFQYVLCVDASVDSVAFQANTKSGDTVKVSRKSLLAAGTDTPVTVTVTSADKKEKRQYRIIVRRAAKQKAAESVAKTSLRTGEKKKSVKKGAGTSPHGSKKNLRGDETETAAIEQTVPSLDSPSRSDNSGTLAAPTGENTPAVCRTDTRQESGTALYLVQNRFPSYAAGMLAAALCAAAWFILFLRRAGKRE